MQKDLFTDNEAKSLRDYVKRLYLLEIEKQNLADAQKDILHEAKVCGFIPKIIRKIISMKKRDMKELRDEEALLELYKSVLDI